MTRRAWSTILFGAVAAALFATAACGGDAEVATSVTSVTTTLAPGDRPIRLPTTTAPSEPPASDVPASGVGDYEGQRYDFGAIVDVRVENGRNVVEFNRQQLYDENLNLISGTQFTEEPIVYGNTDVPYVDDSPKTRVFVLAPNVRVLRIADPVPCASDDAPADPVWQEILVDDLVTGAWTDRLEDTLTFDSSGQVVQVRLSTGC